MYAYINFFLNERWSGTDMTVVSILNDPACKTMPFSSNSPSLIEQPSGEHASSEFISLHNGKINQSNDLFSPPSFKASDLIRLLVLDDKLQVYTTTGGWTRMRAPTPHGFALKVR